MKKVLLYLVVFISTYTFSQKIPVGADLSDNKYILNPHTATKPIVFLNGKEVEYEKINQVPTQKLESVSVLTPEMAMKKYGDKGKNGAILLTYKKEEDIPVSIFE